ncbi:FAD:protein FMN transferase [Eggerthella sinensis]|uniref:FAD:protein FMN transferase n=1 Tax=Eggerthella sinensis TaxID=242230 RepID=UPI001D064BB2|nr:FAD:protein FMN transferase [Eggerthella sinensis]MCB7038682.1 FAD:protein FMN transferase [Eggerthella sinensis]
MISRTFFRFNTTNTISAETDDESVLDEAVALCSRYEQLLSRVDPASELYRLNHAEGRPTRVAPELAAFVETALRYCREVDGAFDVTMGSATRLWDFKERRIPTPADVADALQHVDYRTVHVDGETVTLRDPQAHIDLGGIAKGYIADGILALLRERGVSHALVNLGGNVAVADGKPDGSAWSIGIRKPLPSHELPLLDSFATLAVRDGSVVTSGIYERAFEQNGTLFHHILDPRTGFPARTDVLSATVVAPTSLDADGYTTALVIMGADRALAFAEQHPSLEAVVVTNEGDVLATSGIGTEVPFQLLT